MFWCGQDAFHELRTKQQLGYVVACGVRSVGLARGLSVHVQSAVCPPEEIEAKVSHTLSNISLVPDASERHLGVDVSLRATVHLARAHEPPWQVEAWLADFRERRLAPLVGEYNAEAPALIAEFADTREAVAANLEAIAHASLR